MYPRGKGASQRRLPSAAAIHASSSLAVLDFFGRSEISHAFDRIKKVINVSGAFTWASDAAVVTVPLALLAKLARFFLVFADASRILLVLSGSVFLSAFLFLERLATSEMVDLAFVSRVEQQATVRAGFKFLGKAGDLSKMMIEQLGTFQPLGR